MDIVEQIAKAVLPKVLSNPLGQEKEAGLVSQFIALFATKIAGSDDLSLNANDTGASIIQAVFPQAEERGELITKLSEVHNVDETTTQGLLAKAAPLVTGELNTLAGGSSLQAFLKDHLSLLGAKLPSWATNLIPTSILGALGTLGAGVAAVGAGAAAVGGKAADLAGDAVDAVGNVAGGAVDAVGNVASGAADAVGSVASGAVDAAGSAVDAVGNVASGAADAVGNVASGAADAVGNVAGGAADLAGSAVNKVGDIGAGAAGAAVGAAGATAAAGGGLLKKLLPLLGLIGLGLLGLFLWQSCAEKAPTPPGVDAPVSSDGTAQSTLDNAVINVTTGEGDELYTCNGYVGNQSLKDKVFGAIKNVFGSAEKCDAIRVDDTYTSSLANEDKLQEAFEAAKAVPNASLAINGDSISVDAKDPAARASLVEKLKGILPGYKITQAVELNEEEVVAKGIEASLAALNKLDNKASGRQIAKALNLQVINFATGKFEIPAKNQVVLDKAATLLTGNADAKLAVIGHTDSTGDEAANVTLSNNRANAVKAYLVSKGATAENLVSKGMGSATPVASNATKSGRFQNRRISFDADAATFGELLGAAANGAANVVGDVAEGTVNVVGDVAKGTANVVGDVAKGTANVVGDVAKGTVNVVGDVAKGTANVVGDVAEGTVDAGKAVVKGTVDASKAVAEGTVDAGKAMVGAAASGTAAVANGVANSAENVEEAMTKE